MGTTSPAVAVHLSPLARPRVGWTVLSPRALTVEVVVFCDRSNICIARYLGNKRLKLQSCPKVSILYSCIIINFRKAVWKSSFRIQLTEYCKYFPFIGNQSSYLRVKRRKLASSLHFLFKTLLKNKCYICRYVLHSAYLSLGSILFIWISGSHGLLSRLQVLVCFFQEFPLGNLDSRSLDIKVRLWIFHLQKQHVRTVSFVFCIMGRSKQSKWNCYYWSIIEWHHCNTFAGEMNMFSNPLPPIGLEDDHMEDV